MDGIQRELNEWGRQQKCPADDPDSTCMWWKQDENGNYRCTSTFYCPKY